MPVILFDVIVIWLAHSTVVPFIYPLQTHPKSSETGGDNFILNKVMHSKRKCWLINITPPGKFIFNTRKRSFIVFN